MLKYLSICPVTACAGIYSNLFYFAVCSVLIFTGKFSLTVCTMKESIHIYLILQFASALPFFTKMLYRYRLFFFFFFKALHV